MSARGGTGALFVVPMRPDHWFCVVILVSDDVLLFCVSLPRTLGWVLVAGLV